MLLDLILLLIVGFLVLWVINLKAKLNQAYKHLDPAVAKKPEEFKEDFSLDLKALNSDFTGKIQLDTLTNLPGREAFEDRLLQTVIQSQRFQKAFGLMFVDLNEFHIINEKYGHDVGDKMIIEAANRLKKVVRQIDTLTRFAGDKFVVLLPQLAMPETAAYVAQRLIDSIVLPFNVGDEKVLLTACVGVAIYPHDGHDAKALLHSADDALEQAKKLGPSKYKFFRQELHALGQCELAIHDILSKPDYAQKLIIQYQPQVNTVTGEIVCIQTSPILQVTEFGNIAFGNFSKTALNRGKIIEIGEWLLRNSIQQFQKWREGEVKTNHLSISVTIYQIQNTEFIHKVAQIIQELNMQPQDIVFEIIERDFIEISENIEKSFETLNQVNIKLGLSLFALGRLALNRITKLPVSYLKIDAKLIKNKKDLQEHEGILSAMMNLANEMQINVIAEGVDTELQKELVSELGCTIMQGKLFGESITNTLITLS